MTDQEASFQLIDAEGQILAQRFDDGRIQINVPPEQLLAAISQVPFSPAAGLHIYEVIYAAGAKAGAQAVLSKWVDAEGLYVTTEEIIETFGLTEDEVTAGTIYERPKDDSGA